MKTTNGMTTETDYFSVYVASFLEVALRDVADAFPGDILASGKRRGLCHQRAIRPYAGIKGKLLDGLQGNNFRTADGLLTPLLRRGSAEFPPATRPRQTRRWPGPPWPR